MEKVRFEDGKMKQLPEVPVGKKNDDVVSYSKTDVTKKHTLSIKSLRRLLCIVRILFTSKGWRRILLFIVLLCVCVAQQFVIYFIGMLPSRFFKVLSERNRADFHLLLARSFAFIFLISLCNSLVKFLSGRLYVEWRERLTEHLHQAYFRTSRTMYDINRNQEHHVDNVDQRITQDVERLCALLRDHVPTLIMSPITIIYYSVKCFDATGYSGPLVIYGYFLCSVVLVKIVMSFIVHLVFKQEQCEGDFRYWHAMVRSFAESVSFLKGEKREHQTMTNLFQNLLTVQRKIINIKILLDFLTNFFDYTGAILSYIIISVPIFSGKYNDFSTGELTSLISQNAFVSMYLIGCFSRLIDLSPKLTELFAYSHRIGELDECLESSADGDDGEDANKKVEVNTVSVDNDLLLSLRNVSYRPPRSDRDLVVDLDLTVARNKNLLITGSAGIGKTSLLRVILGLWQPRRGSIAFGIPKDKVLFLPQRTFLTRGTLSDQLMYPQHTADQSKNISTILVQVGLHTVVSRVGGVDVEPVSNWSDILSPGEVQRLSFARLLYHEPRLAVVDEPTSALSEAEERELFTLCADKDITFVTVGHRESLKEYHHMFLNIAADGKWSCNDRHC